MSVYQQFPSVVAALEAFAGGKCRRHVEIEGHVVDLVQASSPVESSRPDDARVPMVPSHGTEPLTRDAHDAIVAMSVAAAMRPMPPSDEIFSRLDMSERVIAAVTECCPTCGRPMIGDTDP